MKPFKKNRSIALLVFVLLSVLIALSGCSQLGLGESSDEMSSSESEETSSYTDSKPYYPTDFNDILIPPELTWKRENSMSIRTESYAGGILNFAGRVEINSLSDFFINSMQKDGWKLAGTVKYKNIMLAFTKPHKTSLFTISETEFGTKTNVYVYITEDITASKGMLPPSIEILP